MLHSRLARLLLTTPLLLSALAAQSLTSLGAQTAYFDSYNDPPQTSLPIDLPDGGTAVSADTIYIFAVDSRAGYGSAGTNTGVVAPAGLNALCSAQVSPMDLGQIFYVVYPAGSTPPTSLTFNSVDNGGWSNIGIIVAAYQGMNSTSPFDGACQSGTTGEDGTSVTAPSLVTSLPNDTVFWNLFALGDIGTDTPSIGEGTSAASISRDQTGGDGYFNLLQTPESSPGGAGSNTLSWSPCCGQYISGAGAMVVALTPSGSAAPAPPAYSSGSLAPFSTLTNGPIDSINLANLNINLSVPIMNKAGRGLPFGFLYTYDGAIYTNNGFAWVPTSSSWGWSPQLSASTGYLTYTVSEVPCSYQDTNSYSFQYSQWAFVDGNGTSHPFDFASPPTDGNSSCNLSPTDAGGAASDNSGYYLTVTGGTGPTSLPVATVGEPDGLSVTPPLGSTIGAGTTEDTNGNTIVSTGGIFTDTTGATVLTMSGTDPVVLTYASPSGGTEQAEVTYENFNVQTNFGCSGISEYQANNVPLLVKILLADGTSWDFSYEPTPGYSGYVTGRIASVTPPTGGTISYSYPGANDGMSCTASTDTTLDRATPDGTTTYVQDTQGLRNDTIVTDPFGNQTTYYFMGNFETAEFVSNASSETLSSTSICYNGASAPCDNTQVSGQITERTITTETDTGLVSERDEHYEDDSDAFLLTELYEYGYGNGSPGPLLRHTVISYDGNLGQIYDRPSEVKVTDGSDNTISDTTYEYDTGTRETSGYANYYGGYYRGNQTVASRWISGSTWATTNTVYYDDGVVYSATDPNGNTTTYNTWGNSCNGAFPISVSLPTGLTTSATWNCYIGLPATTTDANGNTTTYSYDEMYRPTEVDSPGTAAGPRRSVTQFNDDLNTVENWTTTSSDTLPASDTGWRDSETFMDWAGRTVKQELLNDPNGTVYATTAYDADGRPASQTTLTTRHPMRPTEPQQPPSTP